MTMGKSFNKSILFVLGIILVVSAFSGCTDAPASDEPTTANNELYKELLAQDDPEAFKQLLGMNINDLTIKDLGTPVEGNLEAKAEGRRTTLEWIAKFDANLKPKTGLTKYKETHDGSLNGLLFQTDNNAFGVADKVGNDGKIDIVKGRINGQTFEYASE